MIDLRRQIQQIDTIESIKEVLLRMNSERNSKYTRDDVVFLNEDDGPVVKNDDNGHFYRVTVSGTTPAVTLVDLGTKV